MPQNACILLFAALFLVWMTTFPGHIGAADSPSATASEEPEDAYQWLEDVTGEKPLAWVRERNEESVAALTKTDAFKDLNRRLLTILDSDERIPYIGKAGDHYYNFWRDEKNPRGVWRRTTLDEYRKAQPKWETVLDLDALGKAENVNWVWHGARFLKPGYDRCLVSLSRGGSDADVVREFDLKAKKFVKDGFHVPEAKSRVAWRGRDSLFVATDFGPGTMTASGYPRQVREWKRGTPLAEAPLVYEAKADDMGASAYHDLTKGYERDFVYRMVTFWTNEFFLRRDGKLIKIEKPDDAMADVHRDLLFLQLRSDWKVGDTTYPAGALLATDFEAFLKGERRFDVLFTPTERKTLEGYGTTRNHVLLNELDNVRNRLYRLTRKDGKWTREPLPGVPAIGTTNAWAVDDEESDDYFMTTSDYVTPTSYYLGGPDRKEPEKLKHLPSFFKSEGLKVSQREAVSKDGTRVPYFEVSRADMELNGDAPTLLDGYGGFEVSLLPGYHAIAGAAWMEKGGVFVVANIRGGGEFGPKWHQAALKANRNKAYEDFIAVAEDLIRRKVTSPKKLGIIGGSNGGLLMGNMLTMRPDLFGAIVCQVPLLDMRRYNKLLAGASWMGEYGNPDLPEEWAFLKNYSPYHNVKKDAKYPPILVTTSTRDDRVHPGHARKMVAKMKAMGHDVTYYENIEGGHGGAADNKQRAFMDALAYTFLWNRLR